MTEALAAADEHELRFYEAETHRLKGELLSKQDDSNAAEAQSCFERAIEIARTQSAKSLELRATMSLARLLRNTARRDEARAMLAEIYGWFTEGLDTPALSEAKALLDELTSKPSAPRRSNKSRRDPSTASMRVASAFIRKNSDEIPGFRALGLEADEQMTPMLDQLPSVDGQCLLRRPLKLAIYPAASLSHYYRFGICVARRDSSMPASS